MTINQLIEDLQALQSAGFGAAQTTVEFSSDLLDEAVAVLATVAENSDI